MNLVNGEILDTKECDLVLENLDKLILNTLKKSRLDSEIVIAACDKLVADLDEAMYLDAMAELGIDEILGRSYINEARQMFCKESLQYRMRVELGEGYDKEKKYNSAFKGFSVTEKIFPLGVLLHIAAGNADGLPIFSVLEGLLTGNINILKLPAAEGGITVKLLLELIKIEPILAEYIYVFDYSSKDITNIGKLISAADAVIVWGGNEAVSALRRIVPPRIKLIEWGHKISFAYVTKKGITKEGLEGLAKNIALTRQLLCSSIQGIFIDTDDMNFIYDFCQEFLPVLNEIVSHSPIKMGIGIKSQVALKLYNEELERMYKGSRIFKAESCSLIAYRDKSLETSIQFGNPWVRPLPKPEITAVLRPYKNFLQTVGLLCADTEREMISEMLFKTGTVRICPGEYMSSAYCGAPHDGEYSLRRYTKVVSLI